MFFLKNGNNTSKQQQENKPTYVKSWFEERYDAIIVQRNIALFFSFICLCAIILSVLAVMKVSLSRKFDPFVIQIEEKTGATKIVNPIGVEVLSGQTSIAQYFIKLYIAARETYNPVDFDGRARQVVKLLSTGGIYWRYLSYINRKENDPRLIYGQRETTTLKIRSWSEIETKKMIVRFAIQESVSGKIFNKIAIVEYDYVPMELTQEELDINPVGFQIVGYRVDDDYS